MLRDVFLAVVVDGDHLVTKLPFVETGHYGRGVEHVRDAGIPQRRQIARSAHRACQKPGKAQKRAEGIPLPAWEASLSCLLLSWHLIKRTGSLDLERLAPRVKGSSPMYKPSTT
jgi:hypothetical protein